MQKGIFLNPQLNLIDVTIILIEIGMIAEWIAIEGIVGIIGIVHGDMVVVGVDGGRIVEDVVGGEDIEIDMYRVASSTVLLLFRYQLSESSASHLHFYIR